MKPQMSTHAPGLKKRVRARAATRWQRSILFVLLLALAISGFNAPAAWAQTNRLEPVGIGTAGYGSGTTYITSLPVPVTSAVAVKNTVIVAVVLLSEFSPTTVTVDDDSGSPLNTYTNDVDVTNSHLIRTIVFSARVNTALAAGSTITVHISNTGGGTAWISASALSVSGLVAASPADKTAQGTGLIETSFVTDPTVTTTQPDELLIGAFGLDTELLPRPILSPERATPRCPRVS